MKILYNGEEKEGKLWNVYARIIATLSIFIMIMLIMLFICLMPILIPMDLIVKKLGYKGFITYKEK